MTDTMGDVDAKTALRARSRLQPRPLAAEFVGTAILLAAVVGSGIMAQRLSEDVGLQLFANALATIAALAVIIAVFLPVSGAHFNPAVSLALAFRGDLPWRDVPAYICAQIAGGVFGVALANLMFDLPALHLSGKERGGVGQWLAELIATAGLLMVVGFVSRHGRAAWAPALVPAWIPSRRTGSRRRLPSPIPPSRSRGCSPTPSPASHRSTSSASWPRNSSPSPSDSP